jgi:hypothetical protein
MSSLAAATVGSPRPLRALALVVLLLCAATAMLSQCRRDPYLHQKSAAERAAKEEPLLPEAGYLSNTTYTSQFFGFSFDLPLSVQGHQIMLPLMPETEHSLLALQYEKDNHTGYITITAADPSPGLAVNTPEQQEEQTKTWDRNGGTAGANDKIPIPDFMLHVDRFHSSFRHKGSQYAAQYWATMNDYAVKVVIGTNDKEFLRKARIDMSQVRFYCTQDDGSLTTPDGKVVKPEGEPYVGPTVPTYRVNVAIRDEPGRSIPLGTVSDGAYRNPELGLQYDIPKGWEPLSLQIINPSTLDGSAEREVNFLHACSQMLLRIAPQSGDDAAPNQPKPMIILRALDPNCLSLRTATRLSDKRTNDEVAANLEALTEFGQIATDELATIAGHLFMVFHGTIAAPNSAGNDLASRMSQSIFATRYDKLLLVWSLMAPTTADLNSIPTGRIIFAGSPPIDLRASLSAKK